VKIFFIIGAFCVSVGVKAQGVSLEGVVRDKKGGALPFAHVAVYPDTVIVQANQSGVFSLRASRGPKQILVTFTGYAPVEQFVFLKNDTTISFPLDQKINQLNEVVVRSTRFAQTNWIETTRSGTTTLTPKEIKSIPVLGGEADVIKVMQLLPGTVRGVEGSSDLFVRGGAADQNLVLLDDAPIYNTSHLLGFVSVFNPDILQNVESTTGGFPAHYGGRISSVLNVETDSDVAEKTQVSGNVGLIASRLFIKQPLVKNKASIWIAGRRTYIDKVVKRFGQDLPYFFYDVNGKLVVEPTKRDHVELSFYGGRDILEIKRDAGDDFLTNYTSGNNSQVLRWQHRFPGNWDMSASAIRTEYKYDILNSFDNNRSVASSDIEDIGGKVHFSKDLNNAWIKLGVDWTRHLVSPSLVSVSGSIAEVLESSSAKGRLANEVAAHGQYEWSASSRWTLNAGMRTSMAFVKNKFRFVPEPRISARYKIGKNEVLKLNYSRMAQYVHRISNSAVTMPTDIWYPVTDSIKPQTSHQFSVAWQRSLGRKKIYFGVETYYKYMNNIIGFEEGTNLFFNTDFESKLIQGSGSAYGVEILVKKEVGKLTGWVSYTLSWAWRRFDEINDGNKFPSRYDRRHNGAIVLQYALGKRWSVSGVWEFISGSRFTPIIGQYLLQSPTSVGVDLVPMYAPLNSVRLSDSHRLDLGIKFKSKPERKYQHELFMGAYNAYNRSSPIAINIERTGGKLKYTQPGLFGILPFISYGFKF
jgi:hypothetical protein